MSQTSWSIRNLKLIPQAQLIAQSIGQAFQVSYVEFLKANGIEETSNVKNMDYQDVLNQQEVYGEELYMLSNKEMQREVGLDMIGCSSAVVPFGTLFIVMFVFQEISLHVLSRLPFTGDRVKGQR